MKHIFEIKDLTASKESAQNVIKQIDVIQKTSQDVGIAAINVFVNDEQTNNYEDFAAGEIPVKFIPTLR